MRALSELTAWWFAPAPPQRLAALRIAIGAFALIYLIAQLPELAGIAALPPGRFAPVGVVHVLVAPLPVALALAIAIGTAVALLAFVAGFAYRWTAPLAAVGLLWTTTYRSSWGQVFHTENLLVLHVIALACAPAADAWAARRTRPAAPSAGYGWPIKLLVALTAVTYVLAAIAKLRLAGLHWLDGGLLRDQVAIDNLRKAVLGDRIGRLALPLLEHPAAFAVVAIATVVVELGAPLALCGGRIAWTWAGAAWGFHVGVWLAMNIVFPYPLFGIAFAPLFAIERVIEVPREWRTAGRRFT
jgi:hypothetical protein